MACIVCNEVKLSKEFAPYNASEECDHPCLTCLRCLVNEAEKNEQCAYPGCNLKIEKKSEKILLFKEMLAQMFVSYETMYTPVVDISGGQPYVNVTGLTGEYIRIPYKPNTSVCEIKMQIFHKMKIELDKQKLLYDNKEIHMMGPNGRHATLKDYEVRPNSSICLVVCLYSIPEGFNHVVFDLYWGYPASGRDYLDASCLMFTGANFNGLVDYAHKCPHTSVRHSGDKMDDTRKKGHHTIDVYLKEVPISITHLFFVLSAWRSPTISKFRMPSLKFYEASAPDKTLCKTTFTHARNSEAVIMCSMSRKMGQWEVFESGQLSSGNAKRYSPIKKTIQNLISAGY